MRPKAFAATLCLCLTAIASPTVTAAPVVPSSVAVVQDVVQHLLANMRRDRDLSHDAIRRLQTHELSYSESVEIISIWRQFMRSHEEAVRMAESMQQFLQKLDRLHGVPTGQRAFAYSGLY